MIGGTILATLESYLTAAEGLASPIGQILASLAGKTPPAPAAVKTASASAALTVGLDPLPEATAGLTAAGKVADVLLQYEKDLNTPAMVHASEQQKWQAFKDRVNADLSAGNEADLEKLEAQ